jgi:ABC-type Fe3+-hydroxamate transport system substrate-binding protein
VRSARSLRQAALVAAALAACGGRPVPDEATARRVVSLTPSLTEVLYAMGAGDRVVGRTRWCDHPAAALAVPVVGDGIDFNVEAVAARQPDLVAYYPSASNRDAAARLERLGIRTVALRTDSLDQVVRAARVLGRLTGVPAEADSVADAFAAALDSARAAPRPPNPPRVLLLAWDQPPIVIGGGSFQSELVALAGGRNVFDDLPQPSAHVTLETIAARDPDVVLVTGSETPDWARRPEWRVIPAVRERRFVVIEGTDFARPTFRALDAVRRLAAALAAVSP